MGRSAGVRRGRSRAVLTGSEASPATTRGLTRPIYATLFAVTFATAIGNLGLVSVMPSIGRALRIPDALIACTFSLSALIWAFTSPVWARRADRDGRRPMLLLGTFGFALSMGGCAFVIDLGLRGAAAPILIFVLFAVTRSSYGLLGSAAPTAAQAIVADRTQGMDRVRALSGLAGALSLGTIAGPALAPLLLVEPFGIVGPPAGFAVLGLFLVATGAMLLPRDERRTTVTPGRRTPSLWRDPALRPLLIRGLVVASAQAINIYTIGFAIIDSQVGDGTAGQWWIGLAMSLGAAAGLMAQLGIVNLLRPTPARMLWGGAALAVAGNLAAVAFAGILPLVGGFVLLSFGYGLARPGFAAAASMAVGPERQGAVAGAVSSIAGASIAVPPVIAVALFRYWWGAPFAMAALGCTVVALSWRVVTPVFSHSD